jgi:hypothetical protein
LFSLRAVGRRMRRICRLVPPRHRALRDAADAARLFQILEG